LGDLNVIQRHSANVPEIGRDNGRAGQWSLTRWPSKTAVNLYKIPVT
jgi:hypothetical protein